MKIRALLFTAAVACCLSGSNLYATILGINPSGSYAFYDSFTTPANTGVLTSSAGTDFSASSLTGSGGIVTGAGDRVYDVGGASSWSFTGTATSTIPTFYALFKYTTPGGGDPIIGFYENVTLNGAAPTASYSLGTSGEIVTGQSMNLVVYQWTGLGLTNGNAMTLNFANSNANNHVSIDGAYFSTIAPSAVPEPGSIALGCLGIAGAGLMLRRRMKQQAA